jgi:hypothetical protein
LPMPICSGVSPALSCTSLARMWGKRNPHTLLAECKLVQTLWKTIWRFLKKLKTELLCDPVIPLLGICPKKCKSRYNKHSCTPVSMAVLFIIAKLWKQPRCPTTDEWIKIMWGVCVYCTFIQPL